MEIKPGYKLTEVGVIPEDWEITVLGAVCETSSGTTPSRALMDRYYKNGTIAWVKTLDLNNSDIYATDENVTELALQETCLRSYPVGTVLVAMYGGFNQIGRTGLLRRPAAVNQAITAIRPNQNVLVSEYLISNLSYRVDYWKSVASSSRKDPNITSKDIRDFPIALPRPHEQEVIAEALSAADAFLESLEQLVAKKRHLKRGAMQELLTGKKRLPGFGGSSNRYKETEVGPIPEDWEVAKLGDCLSEPPAYGINAPAVHYQDSLPTYIRITDITDDGRYSPEKLVSVNAANASDYFLEDGDLVFARTGASVGKSYRYIPADGRLVFAGFLIRVRPHRSRLNPSFLAAFATTGRYWNWVRQMSMRSGQPGINGNEYAQLPIPRTMIEEQTAIAAILTDIDAEITALEAKLAKARQIKQGMMHDLLSGRIRLV